MAVTARRRWLAATLVPALPLLPLWSGMVRSAHAAPAAAAVSTNSAASARPAVLRFVFSRPRDNPRTEWLIRVYTQLLAELGIGFQFIDVPPKRATAMVLSGEADGELGRTFGYQLLYPALVRVPEPNNAVRFMAYAMRPGVRFDNWAQVRAAGLRCEHRLGIVELNNMLAREVPAERVSSIRSIAQGLQKLRLQRTDLYFDVEEAVSDYVFFLDEDERRAARVDMLRQAGLVLATTGHAYLNPAHAALAPQLAAALARLKHQGDVQRHLDASMAAYRAQLR